MMARAVYTENFEGRGPVVWHVEEGQIARSRAPVGAYEAGQQVEITLMFQRLMGGARIDVNAATAIEGLYAAGEASGGVLGGDRMQGCGFLETQTFGGIAGRNAAAFAKSHDLAAIDDDAVSSERERLAVAGGTVDPASLVERIQTIMWSRAGVVSNREKLESAIAELEEIEAIAARDIDATDLFAAEEARNLTLAAKLVATAKLAREETRSGHGRTDFPEMEEGWVKHVRLRRRGADKIEVDTIPVQEDVHA
jgi:succinate dehydrogenase/fumarate reductase flavoprotein subunit